MTNNFELIHQTIEKRRKEIKDSLTTIEVTDYGAGKPSDKRTQEEMQKGVNVQVKLSDLASIGVQEEKAKIIYDIFLKLKPKQILELGTCLGFSSSYMSLFAPHAQIHTIEGSENIAKIAQDSHIFFKLNNIHIHTGRFDLILPNLLEKIQPIDFAFIDGHHDHQATLKYFKQILPYMNTPALMLFDDIAWSEGMQNAWKEIITSKQYKHYEDFGRMGAIWL